MVIYPHNQAIILNSASYSEYGGLGTGSFTQSQLNSSFWLAEIQVSDYIGTLLLPTRVTGTYAYMGQRRLATDYGYVSALLNVNVLARQGYANCDLQSNEGCGYIYDDTFGYIDFKQIASACGCVSYPYHGITTYQVQLAYEAGLPTGVATRPGILEALTIVAQINLNEKSPGTVGLNESAGDVGVQSFGSLDYREERSAHSLVKTALGGSAKAQYAKRLIDASIRKARRVLLV